jgi:pheromone shutdown protein TraB
MGNWRAKASKPEMNLQCKKHNRASSPRIIFSRRATLHNHQLISLFMPKRSVREGLAIGSTIVLGDRDVEVTLRRLTQALAKTDIRKLLSPDSEVERSMEDLLPENLKSQMLAQSRGGNGANADGAMNVSSMGLENVAIDKAEFQTFVETMKAKDNVKKIMGALQSTAPEIYEAMVAERDVYMGQGLDELGNNLNRDVGSTVAVMGMAHVDGVERYLASKGWKQMSYPCPVLR